MNVTKEKSECLETLNEDKYLDGNVDFVFKDTGFALLCLLI